MMLCGQKYTNKQTPWSATEDKLEKGRAAVRTADKMIPPEHYRGERLLLIRWLPNFHCHGNCENTAFCASWQQWGPHVLPFPHCTRISVSLVQQMTSTPGKWGWAKAQRETVQTLALKNLSSWPVHYGHGLSWRSSFLCTKWHLY